MLRKRNIEKNFKNGNMQFQVTQKLTEQIQVNYISTGMKTERLNGRVTNCW